eukprot:GHVQ01014663.1.p1 GENE.GHVQ01014663.1~~GHVQ01014663.1.p1  ORF type:complete len:369 (-),score=61.57 GHVQ01014663.1:432-1538(-)
MSKMFRAVRHIGQVGEKFRFELLVERLSLNPPNDVTVSIEWVRGPKRTRSKDKLHIVGGSRCEERFKEPLLLIATLFKANPNQSFQPKHSRLQIVEIPGGHVIGETFIDLADYSTCIGGNYATTNLPLRRCLDPKAVIKLVIGCTNLGIVSAEDNDDAVSLRSGLVSLASSSPSSIYHPPTLFHPTIDSISAKPTPSSPTSPTTKTTTQPSTSPRHNIQPSPDETAKRTEDAEQSPETLPRRRKELRDCDSSKDDVGSCRSAGNSRATTGTLWDISARQEIQETNDTKGGSGDTWGALTSPVRSSPADGSHAKNQNSIGGGEVTASNGEKTFPVSGPGPGQCSVGLSKQMSSQCQQGLTEDWNSMRVS